MRWNPSAEDGPTLSPEEQRSLERIEADLSRDAHLDRVLTPRRARRTRMRHAPAWLQGAAAALGLALMVAGLLSGFVLVAAPGFLVLVVATSSLIDRMSLSLATFGLEPSVGRERSGDDGVPT